MGAFYNGNFVESTKTEKYIIVESTFGRIYTKLDNVESTNKNRVVESTRDNGMAEKLCNLYIKQQKNNINFVHIST